jgi:hypothetical protein
VDDQTEESFLMALSRFCALRSQPTTLVTDNAKTFLAAKKALDDNKGLSYSPYLYLTNPFAPIKWILIPPHSPWKGSFYERIIGIIRQTINRVLGNVVLKREQFVTMVTYVSSVVNSRPLTQNSSDIKDALAISPSDFLMPKIPNSMATNYTDQNQDWTPKSHKPHIKRMFKKMMAYKQDLFLYFQKYYITALRERHQRDAKHFGLQYPSIVPKIGDIVMLKDNKLHRLSWPLARVDQINKGLDNIVRSVALTTQRGQFLVRSIQHVYPLEINIDEDQIEESNKSDEETQIDPPRDSIIKSITTLMINSTKKKYTRELEKFKLRIIIPNGILYLHYSTRNQVLKILLRGRIYEKYISRKDLKYQLFLFKQWYKRQRQMKRLTSVVKNKNAMFCSYPRALGDSAVLGQT